MIGKKLKRLQIEISGAVQGVGFRPFLFRLARELGLKGWVSNTAQGVAIEAEGSLERLNEFVARIQAEKPAIATVTELSATLVEPIGCGQFEIRASQHSGEKNAVVLPDLATCSDCRAEILDPQNRRYRYPFTNCTNCGPRFSIMTALPYDRINTTMHAFEMCADCREEYEDPEDRRFHAQPIACHACGPRLALWDSSGKTLAERDEALSLAERCIRDGGIVALKGLGGFHLVCDARSDQAVRKLRERKSRPEKPLAIMAPDLQWVIMHCESSELERSALVSIEAPILLIKKRLGCELSRWVAPENPYAGVMLPYTPLHHLLMADLQFPMIATSGNLAGEPICMDDLEALEKLSQIADLFLIHNRPIAHHVDDSVARVMVQKLVLLRRARGYVPLPVSVADSLPVALAVGAQQKSAIAISSGHRITLSQHISDLESPTAGQRFERVISDFQELFDQQINAAVSDAHPDYFSTRYADQRADRPVRVQHHVAHLLACMAEHSLEPPVLGVVWDGTGYGPDGTVWGGEFFAVQKNEIRRLAHLLPFQLPGGEQAVREPRRSALGLLYQLVDERLCDAPPDAWLQKKFSAEEERVLRAMLARRLNSPLTSSAGRLFDGVASLLELKQRVSFEGQAAMALEFLAELAGPTESYAFAIKAITTEPAQYILDWRPLISAILKARKEGDSINTISARFHKTLAEMIIAIAKLSGLKNVILTGGCFQNKILTEWAIEALKCAGFAPFIHERVPPNDGGIALGQIMAHARKFQLKF